MTGIYRVIYNAGDNIYCDTNGDGSVNFKDGGKIINAIFFGGAQPNPIEAAYANSNAI